jgi:putative ABC transport system permease protein
MKFIFNLTYREIRSSWKRLLFFFLCISIGVGSIVALRSLIQNLTKAVAGDARSLLTADFDLSKTSPFTPTEIGLIEEIIGKATNIEARGEVATTNATARSKTEFKLIDLKGIDQNFPLVGEFKLADGKKFEFKKLEKNGAILQSILLEQLNVKIGDKISIGETEFEIRDTFDEEPGGATGFRLGSRIFVEKTAFETTGLTRIRRRILYRTADDPTQLVTQLRNSLKESGSVITIQSYKESQQNISEQFSKTENYLSLTGLLILVLGGIGVWNVARVFVEQKRKAVAVLKCLGASATKVTIVYLMQILILGAFGSLFGVLLAQLTLWVVQSRFGDALPSNMLYNVQFSNALQGMILGVFIAFLFSMLPLLQIRNIKPNLLLRDENNAKIQGMDWTKIGFAILCLGGLFGVSAWQAGSVAIGVAFLVSLGITSLILYLAAVLLTYFLRKIKVFGSFSISQAINSLYRPGNQTRVILLAVGLGAFVVLAVQSLQTNLVREFDFSRNEKLPSLFLFDIQKSQISDLKTLAEKATKEKIDTIPNIRARISAVNGESFDYEQKEVRQQQGQIGREFVITYRPNLDENETVTEGAWWDSSPSETPEVSVAEDISETLKVGVGSTITFDILGRKITANVTNIRKFDLRNTRTAFLFVFRPGALEKAPQTFAVPIQTKLPAKERSIFQRDLLETFPTIQIIDVQDILTAVGKLLNNFVLAISFVGSFVILSGILILIGSVSLTKSQRIYENAILKTLGAKRKILLAILFAEYGILGLLAGIIGSFFATLLSFGVSKWILDIQWEIDFKLMILGIFVTMFLVVFFGALASFDVLFRKPLATLRGQ